MSVNKKKDNLSGSLADHHREWCAFCLDYIPLYPDNIADRKEFHHVLPEAWVSRRFGKNIDYAWVVPTHLRCHRLMQNKADAIGTHLEDLLAGAETIEDREKLSRWFHDRGYYWFSVLINLDTITTLKLDKKEKWARCQYLLSGAAGIRGAQNLPGFVMSPFESEIPADVALALTNLSAARGHKKKAIDFLSKSKNIISAKPFRMQQVLQPALLRRTAQVDRSIKSASEAVRSAESEYSKNTALVIKGLLSIEHKKFELTEQALDLLAAQSDTMSWLYKAEESFMHALLNIFTSSGTAIDIYGQLVLAQYIYVLLGLQFTISLDLTYYGLFKSTGLQSWTPSDVLQNLELPMARWKDFDEKLCTDIRKRLLQSNTPLCEEILLNPTDMPEPKAGYSTNLLKIDK